MAYAPKSPRCPTRAEQEKILKVSGEHVDGYRDHMLFAFALGSALREHELAALNVVDVMDGKQPRSRLQLEVYKGRGKTKKATKSEYVFLPRALRRKIVQFIKWKDRRGEDVTPKAPLFVTNRHPYQRIALRTIRHACHTWQKRAGVRPPYNFHAFRHAALTNAYQLTKDIRFVQKLARHADINITQIYTHMSDEEMARNVDDLPC